MAIELTAETITIIVGVITLIVGVVNSIITNKQTVKSHYLQIILGISESFRNEWESEWSEILDTLDVDHLEPRTEKVPDQHVSNVRFMLNWVDWLGAMKSSGALDDLGILTSSIGVPIKKIMNAGYTLIEKDTKIYGAKYWENLFCIAEHMDYTELTKLRDKYSG